MFGLNFSPRKVLIIAHDLLVTAAAVVASFYVRFEAVGLMERKDALYVFLPGFIVYAGIVYFLFHLYEFEMALCLAARPDEHRARVVGLGGVAVGARLYSGGAQRARPVLLRQNHHRALLAAADGVPGRRARIAYRYFRYTRSRHHARSPDSNPTLVLGRAADAEMLLRAIESGAVTKIWPVGILVAVAADRGQAIRGVPVLGDFDALDAVVNDLAQRGTTVARVIFTPSALEPDAKPEATLMHARRLGLTVSRLPSLDDGGEALRLAPVNVEDLLLRPSGQDRLCAGWKASSRAARSS